MHIAIFISLFEHLLYLYIQMMKEENLYTY